MENNEIEVLHERVLNRQRYLQNEMLTRWSKVDSTVIKINQITENLLQSGRISIDTLDDSSKDCFALLDAVSDPLLNMLRSNKVTGAFIVVNTDNLEELSEKGIYKNKPGIYVRDWQKADKVRSSIPCQKLPVLFSRPCQALPDTAHTGMLRTAAYPQMRTAVSIHCPD